MKTKLTTLEKAEIYTAKLKENLQKVADWNKEKAGVEALLAKIENDGAKRSAAAATITAAIGQDGEKLREAIGLPKDAPVSDVLKEVKDILDDETDGNSDAEDLKETNKSGAATQTAVPASLTEFSRALAELDTDARAAYYAKHAHRFFGSEKSLQADSDDSKAPASRADFIKTLDSFTDPNERGRFYNQYATRFGF